MDERRELRASDKDREAAVERLRSALNEGRLHLLEYDDRLARAYQSVTYGDLADLFLDLPDTASDQAKRQAAAPHAPHAPRPAVPSPGVLAGLPTWLKVLWGIWFTAVSINLVIWTLVSVSNTELAYFWPMWVAGPSGAALFGLSVGATAVRRGRADRQRRDRQTARLRRSIKR